MGLFSKKTKVLAPVTGKIIENRKIKDETFAQNLLGQTIGIVPSSNGKIVAPIKGVVSVVHGSGHAYCIKSKHGFNVMIHIGINTVEINASRKENEPMKAFQPLVKINQKVKAGDEICNVDFDYIKKAKYDPTTMLIVMEEDLGEYKYSSTINNNDVVAGNQLGLIVKK